jgi:cob(I)alamin adenosyltransferase
MIAVSRKMIAEVQMVRTMVQLTEEQVKALKKMAKSRKTSLSQLVRESVTLYVNFSMADKEKEEKRRRALDGLAKIKKAQYKDREGRQDVSINHDKYLDEAFST